MYRRMKKVVVLSLLSVLSIFSFAQEQKNLTTQKIKSAIRIDGILDEDVWNNVPTATNFIERTPTFGQKETQPSWVKIVYDDEAIYVGAFFEDANPQQIPIQLTTRDNEQNQNVDLFYIAFDTYHDKQNAFVFGVTSAGVQTDFKYGENTFIQSADGSSTKEDRSWDAIWENVSKINDKGWVVEMKIPFAILRFPKKDIQTWGLQMVRYRQQTRQSFWWNETNPQTSNLLSQYGTLDNLKGIRPPLRLFLYPNASLGGTRSFDDNQKTLLQKNYNVGLDIKYGLNESFTLDMTLVPDFGQVLSDNKVLNISPFQQRFDERRPFFTEGADLFTKSNIFYSRRIGKVGSSPELYESIQNDSLKTNERIVANPSQVQLLNASKISGRNSKGLAIAVLNAITKQNESIIEDTMTHMKRNIISEPLTNYNIVIVDQSIKNGGSFTFANANVLRQGIFRQSNVTSFNGTFYDKSQKYMSWFSHQLSLISHPFTNPNNYLVGASNNLNIGLSHYMGVAKISGNWQIDAFAGMMTNKFDPNDLGFMNVNNIFEQGISVKRLFTTPTKHLLKHTYSIGYNNVNILTPLLFSNLETYADAEWQFKNFYTLGLNLYSKPIWTTNFFEAREQGRIFKQVPFLFGEIRLLTDERKMFSTSIAIGFAESELDNDPYFSFKIKPSWRISSKASISWNFSVQYNQAGWGYATKLNADSIFVSGRFIQTYSNTITAKYFFSEFMTLNLQCRHYWSSVQYPKLYFLKPNGFAENTLYQSDHSLDKNYNTFTIDFLYSWQFRRGSFFNVSWKNYVNSEQVTNFNLNSYADNFTKTFFTLSHTNEILFRLIYFLDIKNILPKKSVSL